MYEKRTVTCFWYHFKRRVGKSIITIRIEELVAFFFKGFRSTLKYVSLCIISMKRLLLSQNRP